MMGSPSLEEDPSGSSRGLHYVAGPQAGMKASGWIVMRPEPSAFMVRMLEVEKSGESRSNAILSPAGAYLGVKSCLAPGTVSCSRPVPSGRMAQIAECFGLQQLVSKTRLDASGDQSDSKASWLAVVSSRTSVPWAPIR